MIKGWVRSVYLLQLHLLVPKDGQWAIAEGWACRAYGAAIWNRGVVTNMMLAAAAASSSCSSTSLPGSSPLPIVQTKEQTDSAPEPLGALGLLFASQHDNLVAGKRRWSLRMASTGWGFMISRPCTAVLTTHAGASSSSVQSNWLQEITSGLAFKIQKIHSNIFE